MHLDGTLFYVKCFTIFLALSWFAAAQTPGQQPPAGQTSGDTGQNPNQAGPAKELPPDAIRANYILGPTDQILIRTTPVAEEINEKPFRIDAEGFITLPLVGKIRAEGMSQQELEAELVRRLKEYYRDPQVIISVTGFR